MASPQKEDGYTPIANAIMDALIATNLTGQEFRIAMLIIRKTYGFNKCEDAVSLTQMMAATGMSKIRCSQIINSLQLQKIVTVTQNINGILKKYKFNKDFEGWDTVTENCNSIGKMKSTVTEKRNAPLQKTVTTKDTLTKDTLTKDRTTLSDVVIEKENHTLFPAPFLFPQWIPENTFLEFVQLRKKLRKPLPAESYPRFFIKLKKLCDDDTTGETTAELILDQSIVNGWQGIFELKKSNNGSKAKGVVKV